MLVGTSLILAIYIFGTILEQDYTCQQHLGIESAYAQRIGSNTQGQDLWNCCYDYTTVLITDEYVKLKDCKAYGIMEDKE